jgi:predicted RNase H-like HicB family nuclease
MEYVYPAVFHPNQDGSYTVTFPDLPGCVSEGKSLPNALTMADRALSQWLGYMEEKKLAIPGASQIFSIETEPGEFTSLIQADVKDNRAVKRTVSLPRWMDEKASESGLSLSRVLQDALSERLR